MTHRAFGQEGVSDRRRHIWIPPRRHRRRRHERLAQSRGTAVQHSCLGPLSHWPVLPRPRLAGFQVSTEGLGARLSQCEERRCDEAPGHKGTLRSTPQRGEARHGPPHKSTSRVSQLRARRRQRPLPRRQRAPPASPPGALHDQQAAEHLGPGPPRPRSSPGQSSTGCSNGDVISSCAPLLPHSACKLDLTQEPGSSVPTRIPGNHLTEFPEPTDDIRTVFIGSVSPSTAGFAPPPGSGLVLRVLGPMRKDRQLNSGVYKTQGSPGYLTR